MNNILVIGGSGFIGRNLIENLLERNYKIRLIDISKPLWLNSDIEFIEGSFISESILEKAIVDIDIVYHLASTTLPKTSNEDPLYDIGSNLIGTVKLLELSVKQNVRKFIFISSGGTVYGISETYPIAETAPTNPTCSYGIVKLTIEKYLKLFYNLYGLESCSLRVANPYGKFQRFDRAHGAINVFCHRAIHNELIQIWGDGNIKRDFIYIDDVISAMINAIEYQCKGEEINIGSGKSESLNDIVEIIQNILNKKINVSYLSNRKFDVPINYLDISKAKRTLNWKPYIDLNQGVEKTISWLTQI